MFICKDAKIDSKYITVILILDIVDEISEKIILCLN